MWPEGLVPFSEILSLRGDIDKRTLWVHFYEHDSRFTRLRRNPEKYREILRGFGGVISPDFSVRPNTPLVEAQHRVYENQLFGAYFQSWGIPTIANVRLQSKSSVPWALAGVPRESIIAIGTHGCARQKDANKILLEELAIMHDELNPTGLLVYGGQGKVVEDFCALNGIECRIFPADTGQRSSYRAVR